MKIIKTGNPVECPICKSVLEYESGDVIFPNKSNDKYIRCPYCKSVISIHKNTIKTDHEKIDECLRIQLPVDLLSFKRNHYELSDDELYNTIWTLDNPCWNNAKNCFRFKADGGKWIELSAEDTVIAIKYTAMLNKNLK